MKALGTGINYAHLGIAMGTDLAAILAFAVAVYFRRHARKDLAVVFAFFNIGLLVVVTVIQMTPVNASLGFGLFGILSIIRLRSEPFSSREIGYFFGALVLALLNGIGTPNLAVTMGLNALIIAAIYGLDHPRVFKAAEGLHVTLDVIHTDPETLKAVLSERLGATVTNCTIRSIDYIRDSMELEVHRLVDGCPPRGASRPRTRTASPANTDRDLAMVGS